MTVGAALRARLTAALVGLALLCLPAAPAHAQVMAWWLGSGGGASGDGIREGLAGSIAWWLGQNGRGGAAVPVQPASWWLGTGGSGQGAAGGAAGGEGAAPVATSVSWWLGTGGTGRAQAVPANQTLTWWLGTTADAETDTGEDLPQADRPTAGSPPDYAAWERIRSAAEEALADPETTNLALERLRSEIARWREIFLSAQNANRTRIETIRSQITALGPAPAEGETEAPEIAARRAALNEQLATLQAPGIAAEEAYVGADGLIHEIDTVLRERQASELLQLGPSPLVPANWTLALGSAASVAGEIWTETRDAWASDSLRAGARESLPATLLLIVLGIGLITQGRRWADRLAARFLSGGGRRAKRVVLALLVSLAQVVLPFAGTLMLVGAAFSTGLVGPRGFVLLNALPMIAFVILAARWLGHQVFARADEAAMLPGLAPERRAEGRLYATLLGLLMATAGLIAAVLPADGSFLVARAVLSFPPLVLCGLILFRLGQILVAAGKAALPSGEVRPDDTPTRARLMLLLGRGAMLAGVAGPALAAIGYFTLGRFLVFPTALTLALLAFIIILQRLVADLYALATGRGDDEEEALIPVLIGFGLSVAALPLLALIWGWRTADLTEIWARAREGFTFGETRIAPADFVTFAVVFVALYLATRLVQGALKTSVLPKTKLDQGGQNAVVSGVGYLGIFLAAVIAVTSAGIDLSNLAIVAGALSVGIGFGLQNIVSNFISGIILLVERPISEGDWIEVNGQQGIVRDISVRSTRIETFDRTDVIIPNSDLIAGVVTNFTHGNLNGRIIVKVGVAYGTDTRRVEKILREIAEAHPLVTLRPPPAVVFTGFGPDALEFEIRAILRDVNLSMATRSDMNHEIARRFAEEGIEIPFAQRDIWLRNPEALTGAAPPPGRPRNPRRAKAPEEPSTIDPALQDPPGSEDTGS
jgi:small-conductance mechanosensitive channel